LAWGCADRLPSAAAGTRWVPKVWEFDGGMASTHRVRGAVFSRVARYALGFREPHGKHIARLSKLVPELKSPSDQQSETFPGVTLRAVAPWLASN